MRAHRNRQEKWEKLDAKRTIDWVSIAFLNKSENQDELNGSTLANVARTCGYVFETNFNLINFAPTWIKHAKHTRQLRTFFTRFIVCTNIVWGTLLIERLRAMLKTNLLKISSILHCFVAVFIFCSIKSDRQSIRRWIERRPNNFLICHR